MLYTALFYFGAFLLGLATDWIWTRWMKNVNIGNAVYASNWSVGVYIVGAMYTHLVVGMNLGLIAAYLVGGWLGTYLAVRNHKDTPV